MKMKLKSTIVIAAVGILTACGGGDGGNSTSLAPNPQLLKGTVAGGAAVVGNVIITDSKGVVKTAPIATDGSYSFDVSAMTGPFVLKAAGTVGNTSVTYYSAATNADINGVVNVTPFTDLIVANIAAQLAVTYFSNPASLGTLITPASLAAAQSAMQAKLQPVLSAMGLGNSVDLLHTQFSANHSGLDAVLDLVKVTNNTTTNTATLTNALTNVVIGSNISSATLDTTPVSTANLAGINQTSALTLQTVTTKLNTMAALFANGLPTVTALQNSGLFDTTANFMDSGMSFSQWATQTTTNQTFIGLKFTNLAVTLDPSGTTATIDGVATSNTAGFGGTLHIKLLKDPTLGWLVIGNGQVANMGVNTRAQLDYWSTVTNPQSGSNMLNGLHVYIDAFDYNANHSSAMITDAVVTGPGLPVAGINMHQDTKNTWFDVTAYGSFDLIPECGTLAYSDTGNIAHATGQCIDIAKTVDNGVYTVLLKTANGTVVNGTGDTLQISKKPYAMSELTSAMFPSITSSTINGQPLSLSGLSNVAANQSLAVIWTMPAGLTVNDVNMWSSVSSGANFVSAMKHLGNSTATQTLLGLGTPSTTGPVTNVGVWVGVHDIYGRTFATSKAISQ